VSQFLRNLIVRHSARQMRDGPGHGAVSLVEPRLKSRFESELANTSSPYMADPESTPSWPSASIGDSSSRKQQSPPESPAVETNQGSASYLHAQSQQPELRAWSSEPGLQGGFQPGGVPEVDTRLSVSDSQDNRIKSILGRFEEQQVKSAGLHAQDSRKENAGPGDGQGISGALQARLLTPESIPGATLSGKISSRNTETRPAAQNPQQTGLLHTPDWVAEVKYQLQRRFGALDSRAEPEPVVNVTIGRVEIKAVPGDAQKQPVAADQPGSVMSLDEYLKKRSGRRD
jgi:hypothetical protein